MVKGFGFSDFLGTEFLPDRGVEHLYTGGLAHFGGDTVGWSFREFFKDLGRVWVRGSTVFFPNAETRNPIYDADGFATCAFVRTGPLWPLVSGLRITRTSSSYLASQHTKIPRRRKF